MHCEEDVKVKQIPDWLHDTRREHLVFILQHVHDRFVEQWCNNNNTCDPRPTQLARHLANILNHSQLWAFACLMIARFDLYATWLIQQPQAQAQAEPQ